MTNSNDMGLVGCKQEGVNNFGLGKAQDIIKTTSLRTQVLNVMLEVYCSLEY